MACLAVLVRRPSLPSHSQYTHAPPNTHSTSYHIFLLTRYGGGPALPRLLRPTVKGKNNDNGDGGNGGGLFLDLWPAVPVTTTNATRLLRLYRQEQQQRQGQEEGAAASDNRDDDEGNSDESTSTATAPVPPPSSGSSSDSLGVLDGETEDGLAAAAAGSTGESVLSGGKLPQQQVVEQSNTHSR